MCNAATGICACDAPWKNGPSGKESCNILDVIPHPNNYVPAYGGPRVNTAFGPQNTTSWGGNILLGDDGQYHMWVSAMAGGQGLDSWGHNSQIDHAVASDPMDVFHKVFVRIKYGLTFLCELGKFLLPIANKYIWMPVNTKQPT